MSETCIFCGKENTNPAKNTDDLMKTAEDLEIHGLVDGTAYIENHGSGGTAVCGECEDKHVNYF